ncbi:hypothetical protein EXIGLDRAFT_728453 [Exidia glandulosa HHB12029]|uniref:Uncharacterized protein n=1 Tax=Exidia glandulosa HHB12029 TaxID=1314781 RepID=A0A165CXH6_EXIGL|nr:hypothetical protein EXIGLDRAFT_733712 [Exidia glandulosa HHB12029]KZV83365.1 hypothetical protein EXIGLDRAFT_728453 [Exidia glandulosa HHB12029]
MSAPVVLAQRLATAPATGRTYAPDYMRREHCMALQCNIILVLPVPSTAGDDHHKLGCASPMMRIC